MAAPAATKVRPLFRLVLARVVAARDADSSSLSLDMQAKAAPKPAAPKAKKAPAKRASVDLDLSDTDEASPPPAKKAATGAARKPAAKVRSLSLFHALALLQRIS